MGVSKTTLVFFCKRCWKPILTILIPSVSALFFLWGGTTVNKPQKYDVELSDFKFEKGNDSISPPLLGIKGIITGEKGRFEGKLTGDWAKKQKLLEASITGEIKRKTGEALPYKQTKEGNFIAFTFADVELTSAKINRKPKPKTDPKVDWKLTEISSLKMKKQPKVDQTIWKQPAAAFTIVVMACYWISECIPLSVTALLPVILFPLFEITDTDFVTKYFLNRSVTLLLAGCIVALAFEYSNLHSRIALGVIKLVGAQIESLLFGVMMTCMFLSMWMNNTSTTAMMVPIVYVIMEEFEIGYDEAGTEHPEPDPATSPSALVGVTPSQFPVVESSSNAPSNIPSKQANDAKETPLALNTPLKDDAATTQEAKPQERVRRLKIMFLLAVACSANIGGTGIVTGTATNVIATGEATDKRKDVENFPNDYKNSVKCMDILDINFVEWMYFNIIPMLIATLASWLTLLIYFCGTPYRLRFWKKKTEAEAKSDRFEKEISKNIERAITAKNAQLGPVTLHETFVIVGFLALVVLWMSDDFTWGNYFRDEKGAKFTSTGTPALLICMFLFVIPKEKKYYTNIMKGGLGEGLKDPVLKWNFVEEKTPWGPLVLIGGGGAISGGIKRSGLGEVIGDFLQGNETLSALPPWVFLIVIMIIVALLTTVASNTATAAILSPVLIALAISKKVHPMYFLVTPTVSASYSFILPISTPPNAIVFDKSDMTQKEMAIPGIYLTVVCNIILFICTVTYCELVFGFSGYQKLNYCGPS